MKLTIFTPAYNRAATLPRLYRSLQYQTCHDFEWLVVDDGSTDHTPELMASLAGEQAFPVRYIRKENGGKHTAHNLALELARGEWFLCVDSDDYLAEQAVEHILDQAADSVPGLVAYKADIRGKRLCGEFPRGLERVKLHALAMDHGCGGEFTLVFRTDFAKKYPFPVFPGERFMGESVIYDRMDRDGEFALLPEVITICEYQPDGYSSNFNRLMKQSPTGFCLYFLQRIDLQRSWVSRLVCAGKYWCFRYISGNKDLNYTGAHTLTSALGAVLGQLFRLYYKIFRNI